MARIAIHVLDHSATVNGEIITYNAVRTGGGGSLSNESVVIPLAQANSAQAINDAIIADVESKLTTNPSDNVSLSGAVVHFQ